MTFYAGTFGKTSVYIINVANNWRGPMVLHIIRRGIDVYSALKLIIVVRDWQRNHKLMDTPVFWRNTRIHPNDRLALRRVTHTIFSPPLLVLFESVRHLDHQ